MPSTPVAAGRQSERDRSLGVRLATYNVLLGGGGRWPEIERVVRAIDADVLALQEVDQREPVERLGEALGYRVLYGPAPSPRHQAVLSRLPVLSFTNHRDPAVFLRNSLEVWVRLSGPGGEAALGLHTVHLTAAFQRRGRAEPERLRELAAVRAQVARTPNRNQVVLGDFNSLAPGDPVRASDFFAQINQWRRTGALREAGALGPVPPGLSRLRWWEEQAPLAPPEDLPEAVRTGLPHLPWMVHPVLEFLPRGEVTDAVLAALLPRAALQSMLEAGYVDCLRALHPRSDGFTCPTYQPAVRIDYVLATRELARALRRCQVVSGSGELGRLARRASDHFPVLAEFSLEPERGLGTVPEWSGGAS